MADTAGQWHALIYYYGRHRRPWQLALACASCTVLSSFFLCPADAVKCKLQTAKVGSTSYLCLKNIVSKGGGAGALFRNYPTMVLRDSLFFGMYIFTLNHMYRGLATGPAFEPGATPPG